MVRGHRIGREWHEENRLPEMFGRLSAFRRIFSKSHVEDTDLFVVAFSIIYSIRHLRCEQTTRVLEHEQGRSVPDHAMSTSMRCLI